MTTPKGGRGHKAPYEQTHVRVPKPIKTEVEKLVAGYREGKEMRAVDVQQAIAIAQEAVRQKKSARVSLQKVLTALFEVEVSL